MRFSISRIRWLCTIGIMLLSAFFTLGANGDAVIFVDDDAKPGGDGLSWETAYQDLSLALDQTIDDPSIEQIWVAAGTYKPDQADNRSATFRIISFVKVYGGFVGNEDNLEDRDPVKNVTILTGDLNGDDGPDFENYDDNSYHIVTTTNANINSVLDGFTITAGNANGECCIDDRGGGMLSFFGSTTVADCNFVANKATSGGAIFWEGQSPDIQDCVFVNNEAEEGGAIYIRDGSPSLVNCAFESNLATDNGGGAIANKGGSPILSNCSFSMNEALFGGAISYSDSGQSTLTNCQFEFNTTFFGAGALSIGDFSSLTIEGCSFYENSTVSGTGRGGAIGMTDSTLVIHDCLFSENFTSPQGSGGGGALACKGESNTTISDSTFQFNWSKSSGAILNYEEAVLSIDNCDFIYNFSFSSAGAVSIGLETAQLSNCMFFGNIAQQKGGGVWSGQSTTFTSCVFIENSAGEGGGGIFGRGTIINCNFERNAAVEGGGALLDGSLHVISGSNFTDNWAIDGGGGLWVEQGEATITDCTFTRNKALKEGGGGLQIQGTAVTMSRCSFLGNSTPEDGGGIQALGLPFTLDNVNFSGNVANRGGAISGTITGATNCTFAGNEAFDLGGGIFHLTGPLTLLHCILWNNRDTNGMIEESQLASTNSSVKVSYSCIEGLISTLGLGNISTDPLFVRNPDDGGDGWGVGGNDDFGDLHLLENSPSINMGDPIFTVGKGVTDLDGEPRIQNCRVDMGADETPVGNDCNSNGEPDSCDIYMGISQDCNNNGIPDECDIASGESDDCNGNGIPDDCDVVAPFIASSGQLSPIGGDTPQSFTIKSPPPVLSDVRLSFTVFSDLNAPNEHILVDVNGIPLGVVFEFGAQTCPAHPDIDELIVSSDVFDQLDDFTITMVGSPQVNDESCSGESYIEVSIEYLTWSPDDMDANGVPDVCENIPGDLDGDGIVNTSDLLLLFGSWGDCPDPPQECAADLDGDGAVGTSDLLILFSNWS